MPDAVPLIAARGISKQFAAIEVLRDVDLDLFPGEIHALLGENGAGKSTFAKILAGVHRPSRGTLALAGEPIELASPHAAQRRGITLIHQEPISFPDLSVAENLVLGRGDGSLLGRVPWAEMTREARRLMDLLGVRIDVTLPMRGLSIADQQMVEIARALASDSRLIIMDEPTAPLTPKEVETLFTIARRLRDEGRTIIFISHRLEEVRALCDRVTIFRDGARIETAPIEALSDADIIRLMIGRPLKEYMHKEKATIGAVALAVENLSLPGYFSDISFEVRAGEIVGLGGLVGAGRTDVARAIFGIAPAESGRVLVEGRPVTIAEPSDAIALGLAFVPEDRAVAGIFRSLSVEQNISAAVPAKIAPGGVIRRSVERALAMDAVKRLRIRLASLRQPIGELSGGNQQKAILARWLLTDPKVLILDEPTRGIDIGVKAEFYDMIGELAASGRAILLISSELPELLALCDRILVMAEGRLTADIPRAEASQEVVMSAAVPRVREAAAA
ncbi:sugar ABC transporter ATP-binding protein [Prosthecomicrobium pneumaticum]|uniref:Rhamnose transport system ATP-binding protein n=1 Tax=Prosthecomicrobium pneumaticum TaxID=81895 RepID=A0A7W9FPR3_9HYPH|nr:sugar ABC transporter ATP-binding protein [Prosthecomicrobium pneumaticum]MBB5754511.1 rhamnose transport system ATP-binding protein [Prosthecomicrobium pneumaticum]